jgi:hypothetical protein
MLWPWAKRNLLGQDKEHSPTRRIQTITASDNVNPLSQLVVVTGTTTATLETAVGADNRWHVLVNSGTGTMTIACTGSETIGGKSSIATEIQYATVIVWSDGTNWQYMMSDREEGTWTPTIGASTTNGTHTYSTQYGAYYKDGRFVIAWGAVTLSAKDAAIVGNLRLNGFPFTSDSTSAALFSMAVGAQGSFDLNAAGGYTALGGHMGNSATFVSLLEMGDNVAVANLTAVDLSASSVLRFTHFYLAAT